MFKPGSDCTIRQEKKAMVSKVGQSLGRTIGQSVSQRFFWSYSVKENSGLSRSCTRKYKRVRIHAHTERERESARARARERERETDKANGN